MPALRSSTGRGKRSRNVDIRVLAFGLAAGILLDATVIRSLLVPALVALFGRWNWWMPARLERVLRVTPALASD
jgi:RND superfamily putative drug exporter